MVQVLDTTLREGEQSPAVYFSSDRKLEIATLLDELGVDIIEVGNPVAHADIADAISRASARGFKAKIGAHVRCKHEDVTRAIDTGATFLGVFLSVSDRRLAVDFNIPLAKAVDQISAVVSKARSQRKDLVIRYTPEDAVRSPFDSVIAAATAAVKAGADVISIADTTGYMNPFIPERSLGNYVRRLRSALAEQDAHPMIAVHCHNDRGLAIANALDAYRAGANIIDASVLGLGERCGIADLAELMLNLYECGEGKGWHFPSLVPLYNTISNYSRRIINHNHPLVGNYAFTHYSGVHVKAQRGHPELYQSVDPVLVNRTWNLALGPQSGRHSIVLALELIHRPDLTQNTELIEELLAEVKNSGKTGVVIDLAREFVGMVWRLEQQHKRKQAAASGSASE